MTPEAPADWLHELRNAVNRAQLCATMAQRLLHKGDARAAGYVDETAAACDQLCRLFESLDAVTGPDLRPPDGQDGCRSSGR